MTSIAPGWPRSGRPLSTTAAWVGVTGIEIAFRSRWAQGRGVAEILAGHGHDGPFTRPAGPVQGAGGAVVAQLVDGQAGHGR